MAKIDVEKLKESVSSFTENPHWKKYLEDAPSDQCKKYIKMNFYLSDLQEDSEEKENLIRMMDSCEEKLGLEDWKHLLRYAGKNPFAGKCRKKIAELQSEKP